jgi:hypothetical protein
VGSVSEIILPDRPVKTCRVALFTWSENIPGGKHPSPIFYLRLAARFTVSICASTPLPAG